MDVSEIASELVPELLTCLEKRKITSFLPAQSKAISAGLLDIEKNMLICTPTASGKTLIAEIAAMQSISKGIGKAVYIAPLKALASEKFNEFKVRYPDLRFALSIGDIDKPLTPTILSNPNHEITKRILYLYFLIFLSLFLVTMLIWHFLILLLFPLFI